MTTDKVVNGLYNTLVWQDAQSYIPADELNNEQCLVIIDCTNLGSTLTIAAMIMNGQFLNLETKDPLQKVLFWALYP